jgi:outer membrane protein assembly factor BamB
MKPIFAPILALLCLSAASVVSAEDWPTWRGPRLDGTSAESGIATHWSDTENVVWRTPIPGTGHASPIVWGDRIFTVTGDPATEERMLLSLNATTGAVLWQRVVLKTPPEQIHKLNSLASSTPATDGEKVFCTFLDVDQVVVAAYNFAGEQLWLKRPGVFHSKHGFCSSPVLYKDKVIVNCDHDGDGYIVALARQDGHELWRIARPNNTRSYCAPLIRELAGKTQMVLAGTKCVTSYNPDNGELYWIIDGPTEQFVASMVYSDRAKLLFLTAGFPQHHLLAIRPDGSGNVTETHIAWRTIKGAAYVPSPIAAGDYFLVVSDAGIAHCYEAATGNLAWQQRVGEEHASLVEAGGLVYFLSDTGVTHVVKPGPTYDLVAENALGERTFASPAISGGRIFIRGEKSLFCIGKGPAVSAQR